MSIENKIEELTGAIKELTAALLSKSAGGVVGTTNEQPVEITKVTMPDPAPAEQAPAPAEPKKVKKEKAIKPEPTPEPTPEPEPVVVVEEEVVVQDEPTYTVEKLRSLARRAMAAGHTTDLKELLESKGSTGGITALDKKHYTDVGNAMEEWLSE